jgi:hypothetical protein
MLMNPRGSNVGLDDRAARGSPALPTGSPE